MPAWSVKTRRAPSRHCGDARVYGLKTTATHEMSTPSPSPSPSPTSPTKQLVTPSAIVAWLKRPPPFIELPPNLDCFRIPSLFKFLALKQHLDVVGRIGQQQGLTAAEALATVAREHAALRECLDTIQKVSGAFNLHRPNEISRGKRHPRAVFKLGTAINFAESFVLVLIPLLPPEGAKTKLELYRTPTSFYVSFV